ncbi:MAG: putative monovalent cation/H+ antiporter subunit A [Bacteroidetes bacterium]|jgi:multicomponent Na+:H+ antiporter subunit A|nr:putative monovalent cation/H+ antiporter subunit A [Bacteroidota bacterium]
MLLAIGIGIAAALLAPALYRGLREWAGWALAFVPLCLFVYFATFLPVVAEGEAVRQVTPWVPSFGVDLSFYLDGLSLLFALLITGLGTLIVVYAGGYLKGDAHLGRFYLSLLLFMSAMLGLVLADNLIALFVFWELTSFSSYLLIGYKHEDETVRQSALQALLVTGMGGLALLAGFVLLSIAGGGTFELSELRAQSDVIRAHGLYLPLFALIVLGCFTKSAQVPFHFWLPNAMAAPTPVSAYLHSATMVKAGIYLLARFDGMLGGTTAWVWTLSVAGALTMLLGAVLALRHTDLKKVLAYSTITALGTLTLLIGLSFEASIKAAIVFLIVHSFYKGALFLVAGSVDYETGTRDVLRLGGLRRVMPVTATAAGLAGLSMAGLPPLFGFVGKELAYKAKLGFDGADLVLPTVAVVANALTVAAAGIVVLRPFFGALRETPRTAREAPLSMLLGPLGLAGMGLLFGLLPTLLPRTLVGSAVTATLGNPIEIELTLWYGLNLALLLSVVTAGAGVLTYLRWDAVRGALARMDPLWRRGPERGYAVALRGLLRLAEGQTRLLQNGSLRAYLRWLVALAVVLPGVALWMHADALFAGVTTAWAEVLPHEWVLAVLIVGGSITVVRARSRLLAVAALGVVGFSVALLFIHLGAPDLAMTQFLVETLIVVIVLLVLWRLPAMARDARDRGAQRVANGVLAVGAGAVVTALALAVLAVPFDPYVSTFFAEESVASAYGRNIVNVILVDFRALDTLGEITVLAVAALGAYVLVHVGALPELPRVRPQSVILRTATRFMIALLLLASLFLLWRGHNEPGGGFIGGLIGAGAFALYAIAFGLRAMQQVLRVSPRVLLGVGLALALVSGLFALAAGEVFLTGQWITVPLGGAAAPLKLGTPLLFDIGVYLVVIGFTLTILRALEQAPPPSAAPVASSAS